MNREIVLEKIKNAKRQRMMTNCYTLDVVERCKTLWSHEDEFVFSYEDHGIQRVVYFVRTWESLDFLLKKIEKGQFFLEFMTKETKDYIPNGAILTACMKRMINKDCSSVFDFDSPVLQYRNSVPVEIAKEQDATEINKILWDTFHTEISHLLSTEELKAKIIDGQLMIHRDEDDRINALLQADIMPKKFYINQVVNKGSREIIHTILLNKLEEYVEAGGKYLYSWVEDKNIASIKFHEKYGMKHDGMYSMIYYIER